MEENKAPEEVSWGSHGSICWCMCFVVWHWAAEVGCGGDPAVWVSEWGIVPREDLGQMIVQEEALS